MESVIITRNEVSSVIKSIVGEGGGGEKEGEGGEGRGGEERRGKEERREVGRRGDVIVKLADGRKGLNVAIA